MPGASGSPRIEHGGMEPETAMNRYLVILIRRPRYDASVVPQHRAFLEQLRAEGRNEMSGPFSDNSGGAYLLLANDYDEAVAMAHRDPAYASGGWDLTIYEWKAR
jgi:uncharacterized protein YciI